MEAAVEAFAEKGFHGTTTRDVAAAAGMSPAALYMYYRSKEELLYLIAKDGHERTLHVVQNAAMSAGEPCAALHQAVRDFAIHHARAHTRARVVNYELTALAPEHLAEMRKLRQQIGDELRGLVARGVEAGVFDVKDAQIAATALLSLGVDVARWYHEGVAWTPEEIGQHYADMALRIVGAHPPV